MALTVSPGQPVSIYLAVEQPCENAATRTVQVQLPRVNGREPQNLEAGRAVLLGCPCCLSSGKLQHPFQLAGDLAVGGSLTSVMRKMSRTLLESLDSQKIEEEDTVLSSPEASVAPLFSTLGNQRLAPAPTCFRSVFFKFGSIAICSYSFQVPL